jgi:signal transduction histidine kinase/ligand-binding sensor domain-containing protein
MRTGPRQESDLTDEKTCPVKLVRGRNDARMTLVSLSFCIIYVCAVVAEEPQITKGGETAGSSTTNYRITRWTTEQGLPQNRVTAITQTPDGYLWLGTWFGLVRFDGARFVVFDHNNTPELKLDAVSDLVVDKVGALWIATDAGLLRYQSARFYRFEVSRGQAGRVWQVEATSTGEVWVRTDSISRLGQNGFEKVFPEDGFFHLHDREDGTLRMLRSGRMANGELLNRLPGEPEFKAVEMPPKVSRFGVTTGMFDQTGRSWFGTGGGDIMRLQGKRWETFALPGNPFIIKMFQDSRGVVWVLRRSAGGAGSGLDEKMQRLQVGELACHVVSASCVYEDRDSNLWLGTEDGLVRITRPLFRTFTTRDGLPDNNCWSVSEGSSGEIWVGTDKGVARIANKSVIPIEAELPAGHQSYALAAKGDSLWVMKDHAGVFRLNTKEPGFENIVLAGEDAHFWKCRAQAEMEDGSILIGNEAGVACWKTKKVWWLLKPGKEQLLDVRALQEDNDGSIWIGTYGQGLLRVRKSDLTPSPLKGPPNNPPFSRYTTELGLAHNRVYTLLKDRSDSLWVGTENGLSWLPRENKAPVARLLKLDTRSGLPENVINHILEDDFGNLWLGGMRGIYKIPRRELEKAMRDPGHSLPYRAFGFTDGLESTETNGENQPNACRSRDGRLWFPTTRGVAVVDPGDLESESMVAAPLIEEVWSDRELVFSDGIVRESKALVKQEKLRNKANEKLKFGPAQQRLLKFVYTAPASSTRNIRFRCRLSGHEEAWRLESGERVAWYANLRPGEYQFEVQAAQMNGTWNLMPAKLAFSVAPYYWQTTAFNVICALGGIGLVGIVQRYRLVWQRRFLKLEEERALESQRTRIARDLHDDLGTALTGLALELDVIRRENHQPAEAGKRLAITAKRTRELAERMREVVWTVNPRCDNLCSLASFLEQQTEQFLKADGISGRLQFPEEIPEVHIASATRHQLTLAVREALTNVIRHAAATEVVVSMNFEADALVVQVADNGRGFSAAPEAGHGLGNMSERLEQIGGKFTYRSGRGTGTVLEFRVPINDGTEGGGEAQP